MRAVLLLLLCAGSVFGQSADLILQNGKIVTVDAKFTISQAMAVRGERIAAVGTNAAVLRLRGPATRVIDLGGKTVLPGLMDSHTHAAAAAMYEWDHPVPDMRTVADVLRYIESRTRALAEGQWIYVSQVFITRLEDQRYPTRAELDRAAPKHPVVFRTGPDASLNSLALKLSGITRAPHPSESKGGKIERDASGEPTGILRSSGLFLKIPPGPRQPTAEDRLSQLKKLIADYNAVGLTSIADRDASDNEVELYRRLKERGELNARVFLNYHIEANEPLDKVEASVKRAAAHPLHQYDSLLWLRGVKTYLDGGMLTGSAYMREPWGPSAIYSITDPNYRGLRYIEPERLFQVARLALKNGLQFTAHSQGDGAVHAMIDAYERLDKEMPVRPHRPCITHASFMSPEAVERMAKAGIVADLQPAWLEHDGATLLKHFGAARLRFFHPYKSLFAAGVTVGGGSDHMQKIGGMRSVNAYNPWFGMWITLTRQARNLQAPLHPEERITREQAIRLYTINNAFLMFGEKEKGSLETGKLADFIVLKQDVLTCPLDQVKSIEVERTFLGGKQVHGT
jgi:predicted amidohydrolase YtcJ